MLKLKELAAYINVLDIPKDWETYYDEAMANFDEAWFNDRALESIIEFYEFDNDFAGFLRDLWWQISGDVNLIFLVYLWYYILYEVKIEKRDKWDFKLSYFKDNGSLYMPMISMLMGYKIHEKRMQNYDLEQQKIQKKIIRDVCCSDYYNYGILGMRFSNMEWGSRFVRGQIVQIGILQYELKKKYLDGKDVIFIHIPRSNLFNQVSIDESLSKRTRVFDYFNVSQDISFVCESWLFSPELKSILKDSSSILYFQDCFNIVEVIENNRDFVKFVFNEPFKVNDYQSLKEETSLQKALKVKLINNEKLHIALGILK